MEETTLLHQATTYNSFEVLLLSLQNPKQSIPSNSLFEFLDNSILRCLRKPVKYHDDLAAIVSGLTLNTGEIEGCKVDLLLITILDQWPFLTKSENPVIIKEVTLWIVRYLDFIKINGGSLALLSMLREMFKRQVRDKDTRGLLEKALKEPTICGTRDELKKIDRSSQEVKNPSANLHHKTSVELYKDIKVPQLPTEDEDHLALMRWAQMGISEAIKDGQIGGLILCLCSKYEDIRKQAILNLGKFTGIMQVCCTLCQQIYANRPRNLSIVSGNRHTCLLEKSLKQREMKYLIVRSLHLPGYSQHVRCSFWPSLYILCIPRSIDS